jgi:hypothetical protein
LLGKKCTSTGGAAGLIDTVRLLATFGELESKARGDVLLKPVSGNEILVPVKCGEAEVGGKGSIIGEFTTTFGRNGRNL